MTRKNTFHYIRRALILIFCYMSLAGLYHDGSSTLVCLRRMNYLRSTVSLSRLSTTYNRGIPLSSLIALLFIRDLLLRAVIT